MIDKQQVAVNEFGRVQDADCDANLDLIAQKEADINSYLYEGEKNFVNKRRKTVDVLRINRCDGYPSLEGPRPINIKVDRKSNSAKRTRGGEIDQVNLPESVKRR